MTELNELVVVEKANVPALFAKDGCDPLLERIKEEVGKFEADISTAKGRKEVASMASKVAKSKVYLEGLGKDLVTGIKEQAKIIDAERKKVRDELDFLKEEVRKPLTDWEDAEKKRVTDIEERVEVLSEFYENAFYTPGCDMTPLYINCKIEELKAIVVDESFEEFELAASKAKDASLTQLEAKFIVLQAQEREKAEAGRAEEARLVNEKKEREDKIAKDAAEAARIETEEKGKAEAEKKELEEKEEREKLEKETLQAQLDKEKAERETKEAEALAEKEKKEAAEQAEEEKKAAIEEERKKVADQTKADEEAEEKRQGNIRHRNKIHKEAKGSMMENGISEEDATIFVTMVKDGLVKNITINY